jgi:hypothetical protein
MCNGTGTTWMGVECEVECSYCCGTGEISNKELFTVEVRFDVVVWAKDEHDAHDVAVECARDALDTADFSVIRGTDCASIEWEDGIPYGDEPDEYAGMTVKEIKEKLREIQEAWEIKHYVDPNQLELF